MKPIRNACAVLACAALLVGQFGCSTTKTLLSSTKYSASAYNTDKTIKAQSLALIDRAKDKAPYTGVAADVDQLMKKVDAAIAGEGQNQTGPHQIGAVPRSIACGASKKDVTN